MIAPTVNVQLRGTISVKNSRVRRAPASAARPMDVITRKGALRASVPAQGRPHQYGINAQYMALAMATGMVRAIASDAKEIVNPENIVGDLLESIEGTDNGANLSPEKRTIVDGMINTLETCGEGSNPLDDPRIFGNYDVTYVSAGDDQKGNPAGGRFRSGIGKFVFRTTELQQNLYEPDVVVNKVGFKLAGVIPGQVTLSGTIAPEPADQQKWIRAKFDSPKISFAGLPPIGIGPPTSVVLATTYLDDKVRLGKGSLGSLFVFTRAEGGKEVLDSAVRKASNPLALAIMCAYALCAATYHLSQRVPSTFVPYMWGATVVLGAVIALIMKDGGIIDGKDPVPVKP